MPPHRGLTALLRTPALFSTPRPLPRPPRPSRPFRGRDPLPAPEAGGGVARGGAKDAGKRAQTARRGARRAGRACRSAGGARPAAEPGGGAAARGHAGAVAEVEQLPVRMDVLGAPSMGWKRNGVLTAALMWLLGAWRKIWGAGPGSCPGQEPRFVVVGFSL